MNFEALAARIQKLTFVGVTPKRATASMLAPTTAAAPSGSAMVTKSVHRVIKTPTKKAAQQSAPKPISAALPPPVALAIAAVPAISPLAKKNSPVVTAKNPARVLKAAAAHAEKKAGASQKRAPKMTAMKAEKKASTSSAAAAALVLAVAPAPYRQVLSPQEQEIVVASRARRYGVPPFGVFIRSQAKNPAAQNLKGPQRVKFLAKLWKKITPEARQRCIDVAASMPPTVARRSPQGCRRLVRSLNPAPVFVRANWKLPQFQRFTNPRERVAAIMKHYKAAKAAAAAEETKL